MDELRRRLQTVEDGFGEERPMWKSIPRTFGEVAREIEEMQRKNGGRGCTLVFEYIPKPEDIDFALREIYSGWPGGEMFAWSIPHPRMLPKPPGSGDLYAVIRNADGNERVSDDSVRIYYFQPDSPLLEEEKFSQL